MQRLTKRKRTEKPLDQLRIGYGRGLGKIYVLKIFDLK